MKRTIAGHQLTKLGSSWLGRDDGQSFLYQRLENGLWSAFQHHMIVQTSCGSYPTLTEAVHQTLGE